jgi:hypothetical protein
MFLWRNWTGQPERGEDLRRNSHHGQLEADQIRPGYPAHIPGKKAFVPAHFPGITIALVPAHLPVLVCTTPSSNFQS